MIAKPLVKTGAVAAGLLAVLGVEALLALNRDYIKDGSGRKIRGEFGDRSLPPFRLVVLGDSTAIGLGAEQDESFPWLLAKRLSNKLHHVELHVLGTSGARVSDVVLQAQRAVELKPDLVLIEIGANDATHATRIKNVRTQMGRALDELLSAGLNVVVAGPPHMGTSRAFLQPLRALSGLNGKRVQKAIEAEASARNVPFIDLSVTAPAFKNEPQKHYSTDMFHPGAKGYEVWANTMEPAVTKAASEAAAKKESLISIP